MTLVLKLAASYAVDSTSSATSFKYIICNDCGEILNRATIAWCLRCFQHGAIWIDRKHLLKASRFFWVLYLPSRFPEPCLYCKLCTFKTHPYKMAHRVPDTAMIRSSYSTVEIPIRTHIEMAPSNMEILRNQATLSTCQNANAPFTSIQHFGFIIQPWTPFSPSSIMRTH